MKNFKCCVEDCQRAFSDAASKIRHERNVHGVLPARRIVRNRSHLSDEAYESEGQDYDVVMDPGLPSASRSSSTPLDLHEEEEKKPRNLEEVSPYTLVPTDYFGHQKHSWTASPFRAEFDTSLPPPSPTPSNFTSISTVVTEASQSAVDGVLQGSDKPGEVPKYRKLLTAFTSRGRALSAPDISLSGLTRVLCHSQSPSPRQDPPPKRRTEDAHSSLAGQVKSVVSDVASDPLDKAPKPFIRLPGIDDLLRGPTAPDYRHDAQKQQSSRHGSRSSSKSRQPASFTTSAAHDPEARPRALSVAPGEHVAHNRQSEISNNPEPRSRSNGTPPRRTNSRPSIATHFSPYGTLAERQRLPIGRARAHSEVFAPNPVRPIGLERPASHWRSDGNQEIQSADFDEQQRIGSPTSAIQPRRRQSLDPLFGFLSRRPLGSTSSLDSAGLAGSVQSPGQIDRSTADDSDGEMADDDQGSSRERDVPQGYFISTIMTDEPLSPSEGAKCRILRSDGRILPAKLVNERGVALLDDHTRQSSQDTV